MKYVNQSFSLPVCAKPISQLEYDLRVGNLSQQEFDAQERYNESLRIGLSEHEAREDGWPEKVDTKA